MLWCGRKCMQCDDLQTCEDCNETCCRALYRIFCLLLQNHFSSCWRVVARVSGNTGQTRCCLVQVVVATPPSLGRSPKHQTTKSSVKYSEHSILLVMLQEASYSANGKPASGENACPPETQAATDQQEPSSQQQQQQQQEPKQQQDVQQQQPRLVDSTILEWCSQAEELMQQANMGRQEQGEGDEQALPVQSPLGTLQRGLTALPAYSG